MSSTSANTQLTTATGYNTDRMIFSEPVKGSIAGTSPEIKFQRIYISSRNEDGSIGDLLLPTERCYSFGVSENKDPNTGEVTGYVFPLCLHSRGCATSAEKEWVKTFNNIVDRCKDYLLDHKEDIEQYELERADLRKLNPLYYKKEKGQIVPGTGPTLYAKLMMDRKSGTITSLFYDENDCEVNPLDLLNQRCNAQVAMKFESIFIGSKISIQIKLYEASVTRISQVRRRFFGNRVVAPKKVEEEKIPVHVPVPVTTPESSVNKKMMGVSDSDSDSDYISSDSESEVEVPVKKVTKKVRGKSKK